MKRIKRRQRSLIFSCAVYFALFAGLIVLIYSGFQHLANQRIGKSVFTMEDLLSYEDRLIQEDYARLPAGNSKNSAMIIFDENGIIQYASNQMIRELVFFEDLDMLGDYHTGSFFNVFQDTLADGTTRYTVYLNSYDMTGEDLVPKILDYCILDGDLRILEGTLFPDRSFLTQREFELLNGISRTNSMLEKYVYENADGEERILAFLSTNVSDKQYNEIIRWANAVWMIGIPCVLLAVIGFTVLFYYKIKRRIAPLNQTIQSYEKGKAMEISPGAVPSEFYEVVCNFKSLLSKLEKTREEKEALDREKQKLIVDISHDLKTPLTVIQGYAKALSDQRVPPEKQAQCIAAIYQKSRLATDMVNDLFLLTQMEHPDYPLQLEETDFCEFVKSFFAEKYMELTEGGFGLSVDIPEAPMMLPIDRKLMRRLLENLLSNAMKYNPPGTTLYVAMGKENQGIALTVADDGAGIPEEIARTLFQPFVTGNRARTTGKGTGLGLSIAQKIVQMHRGEMSLIRPPRKPYKTEFRIRIPIQPDSAS